MKPLRFLLSVFSISALGFSAYFGLRTLHQDRTLATIEGAAYVSWNDTQELICQQQAWWQKYSALLTPMANASAETRRAAWEEFERVNRQQQAVMIPLLEESTRKRAHAHRLSATRERMRARGLWWSGGWFALSLVSISAFQLVRFYAKKTPPQSQPPA